MEKLKAKHDHKLTDIIKVAIFGLMLLLPFISWMPNAFYYGFNEHAVVGQEEQYYNFYQGVKNGNFSSDDYWVIDPENNYNIYDNDYNISTEFINDTYLSLENYLDTNFIKTSNDYVYYTAKIDLSIQYNEYDIEYGFYGEIDNILNINIQEDYKISEVFSLDSNDNYNRLYFYISDNDEAGVEVTITDFMLFNLTTIFGSGNEPTKEEFENMLTQEYYNYGNNYVLKDRGTNITWSMYNSWEDVWQTPLFSWTNNSILKTGLNAFCGAFGIVDSSYITNLLVYELVIVAIYIVLDIVLTLFKWLTHIGQKE